MKKGSHGTTLIELMGVLAITGILASLIAYSYIKVADLVQYEGVARNMQETASLLDQQRLAGRITGPVNYGWIAVNWPEYASRFPITAPWGSAPQYSNHTGAGIVSVDLPSGHPFSNGYSLTLGGTVSGNTLTVVGGFRRSSDLLMPSEVDKKILYKEPLTW